VEYCSWAPCHSQARFLDIWRELRRLRISLQQPGAAALKILEHPRFRAASISRARTIFVTSNAVTARPSSGERLLCQVLTGRARGSFGERS